MSGSADVEQARVLCDALCDQIRAMGVTLAKLESVPRSEPGRALVVHRQAAEIRRDMSKARFLVEQMQRRFPEITDSISCTPA